ncbi:MAG: universal stress protein [Oryzomonas sp.]|nr:universal stress protein [Oryzomonas sp.]MDR3580870.1 universal stress protein [Oryzomonas sp.]
MRIKHAGCGMLNLGEKILAAIGSYGKGFARHRLKGSVFHRVARSAPCSV